MPAGRAMHTLLTASQEEQLPAGSGGRNAGPRSRHCWDLQGWHAGLPEASLPQGPTLK